MELVRRADRSVAKPDSHIARADSAPDPGWWSRHPTESQADCVVELDHGQTRVVALIVLILLLVLLGGGGMIAPALHILWLLLVIGLVLWVLGFFVRAVEGSRWYYW